MHEWLVIGTRHRSANARKPCSISLDSSSKKSSGKKSESYRTSWTYSYSLEGAYAGRRLVVRNKQTPSSNCILSAQILAGVSKPALDGFRPEQQKLRTQIVRTGLYLEIHFRTPGASSYRRRLSSRLLLSPRAQVAPSSRVVELCS